jgi:hypothetical protein
VTGWLYDARVASHGRIVSIPLVLVEAYDTVVVRLRPAQDDRSLTIAVFETLYAPQEVVFFEERLRWSWEDFTSGTTFTKKVHVVGGVQFGEGQLRVVEDVFVEFTACYENGSFSGRRTLWTQNQALLCDQCGAWGT